jgi:hypothetical protein
MSETTAGSPRYIVSVHEPEHPGGALVFSFVPKGPDLGGSHDGLPGRIPRFVVEAREQSGGASLDWTRTPDVPDVPARQEIEREILARMRERAIWIERVNALVDRIEGWAIEMGWTTRRVEKKLDDHRIGKHRVPALLMQEDVFRVLLEPVGRSSPGAEGVVDLYLMPAYDDIASLYFYDGRWNLHYLFPGATGVGTTRDADPLPLSKEGLQKVLAEMRLHAA